MTSLLQVQLLVSRQPPGLDDRVGPTCRQLTSSWQQACSSWTGACQVGLLLLLDRSLSGRPPPPPGQEPVR
jgi:hypothetical protein